MLDRVAKSLVSLQDRNRMKSLTDRFSELKEDFDRALSVEAFKEARNIGKYFLILF